MIENKEYDIVAIIKDQWIKGWRRPVTILLTKTGETLMTEFDHDFDTGKQIIRVGKANSYNFPTAIKQCEPST